MRRFNGGSRSTRRRTMARIVVAIVLCLSLLPILSTSVSAVGSPTVGGVTPPSGSVSGGSLVTITGTDFLAATQVSFGSATSPRFIISSDTQLAAIVPAGATVGPVTVTVNTTDGPASATSAYTYTAAAPHVYNVYPRTGTTVGGNTVTVTGTGFLAGNTAITFGGVTAAVIGTVRTVGAASVITANVPMTITTGPTDVQVTTPGGSSALGATDQYTYTVTRPIVQAISPNSGTTDGGATVTVTGTGFLGANDATVYIGNLAAPTTGQAYLNNGLTVVTATTPLTDGIGGVPVTLKSAQMTAINAISGTSPITGAPVFTYTAGLPTISAISPASGTTAGHQTVTITGTNFLRQTGSMSTTVYFGAQQAITVGQVSLGTGGTSTVLTATTPVTTANVGNLVDTTAQTLGGTSATSTTDQYQYTLITPTITGVSPISGPVTGLTAVTITGTDFVDGATQVYFNGNPAHAIGRVSSNGVTTVMTATSSAGNVINSPVDITLTTPASSTTPVSLDHFTYTAATPSFTSLWPLSGTSAGGETITITGTGFVTGGTTVTVGGIASPLVGAVSVNDLTSVVTATVPVTTNLGPAAVKVQTAGGTTAASGTFTYTASQPVVTAISPVTGTTAGGTIVTITATGLLANQTSVKFGTTSAITVGKVLISGSTTTITATSPTAVNGMNGMIDVQASTTAGGASAAISSTDGFTYTYVMPTVTAVSPASGTINGGTTVTITGTNFVNGESFVMFGGTSASVVGAVQLVGSSTVITAVSPAYPGSGPAPVDIQVYTAAGLSAVNSPADQYTYTGSISSNRRLHLTQPDSYLAQVAASTAAALLPLSSQPALERATASSLMLSWTLPAAQRSLRTAEQPLTIYPVSRPQAPAAQPAARSRSLHRHVAHRRARHAPAHHQQRRRLHRQARTYLHLHGGEGHRR